MHSPHARSLGSRGVLRAAHDAGIRELRLIHGRGQGVQRGSCSPCLERHALVVEFWDDADSRLGATWCRLA
jgi:hypothetical protein